MININPDVNNEFSIVGECPIKYKEELAEIPDGAKHYASLYRKLKEYKSDLKKAKRTYQPDNVIRHIMQRVALIEKEMREHAQIKDRADNG